MYERIMIPLDGSSAAEIVLPYAEEIAAKLAAEIILVSVSRSTSAETDHFYRSYLERIKEQLQHRCEDWGAKGEAKVQTDVLLGRAATEILRYADENNVSLITMASRGGSSRGPRFLGNTAAKVLRTTVKPVLLIKVAADSAALQQRRLIKRILLPLDGSKVAEQAMPPVRALSQVLGSKIVLFQVFKPLKLMSLEGFVVLPLNIKEDNEYKRAVSMAYLDSVGTAFHEEGLSTSSEAVSGSPAKQILDYSEANAIDLIAMSTHGRSGIGRWVFGSVTDKVLHAGDTAVLAVRATKVKRHAAIRESLAVERSSLSDSFGENGSISGEGC
jgi:nucleotide-binding universal stress UspA family protein